MPISKRLILWGEYSEIEVTAICDISEERRNWAASIFEGKNIQLFTDVDDIMKSGLIDAVYIAVPHYDHPTLAFKAFGYGLHVMSRSQRVYIPKQCVK